LHIIAEKLLLPMPCYVRTNSFPKPANLNLMNTPLSLVRQRTPSLGGIAIIEHVAELQALLLAMVTLQWW
jgi:hypothetical protein